MTSDHTRRNPLVLTGATVAAMVLALHAADPPDFNPDGTFTGSSLKGWQIVGDADWKAQDGQLIGRSTSEAGGWLVMNKPLQDLQFDANVRCEAKCRPGVLLRAERPGDGGLKGIYVSFADGDFVSYRLTLTARGQETTRERIGDPPTGNAASAAANAALKTGEWNPIRINLWENTVRPVPGAGGPLPEVSPSYGSIALFVGGGSTVTFKDVAWKDVNRVVLAKEEVSSRFASHQISTMYCPAVIYIYRTVRNAKAPGGAEFVPELVHNRSGVGSAFEVMDLNKDGRPDIAVATAYGTHVFLSKPVPSSPPSAR